MRQRYRRRLASARETVNDKILNRLVREGDRYRLHTIDVETKGISDQLRHSSERPIYRVKKKTDSLFQWRSTNSRT